VLERHGQVRQGKLGPFRARTLLESMSKQHACPENRPGNSQAAAEQLHRRLSLRTHAVAAESHLANANSFIVKVLKTSEQILHDVSLHAMLAVTARVAQFADNREPHAGCTPLAVPLCCRPLARLPSLLHCTALPNCTMLSRAAA